MEPLQKISPKLFITRAFLLFLTISFCQLFHLTVVCEFEASNIIVWAFVVTTGMFFFLLIYAKVKSHVRWPELNVTRFTVLFLLSLLVTLCFSRVPYILVFLEKGMYYTRLDSGLGSGGWYTYIAVIFYPLCIVLAFINIRRRLYYQFFALMMIVVVIDLVVLGTRGIPSFVMIFHFLMLRSRLLSAKSFFFMVGLLLLALFVIDYQTQARSLNTITVGWDWVRTIKYSWIFDTLKVKNAVIVMVNENVPFLFPLIYLLQYITHSIAEFSDLLTGLVFNVTGSGLYLQDEICLVAGCDRTIIHESIAIINPRVGLYQTLYASLLFDFGFLGFLVLLTAVITYIFICKVRSSFVAVTVFFAVIIAVSGVENYFYNGLGLARFFVFVIIWKALSLKFINNPISKRHYA